MTEVKRVDPATWFRTPVLGKIVTRKIKDLYLDGKKASIDDEREFEYIDTIEHQSGLLYVTNEWGDFKEKVALFIHEQFVKERRKA